MKSINIEEFETRIPKQDKYFNQLSEEGKNEYLDMVNYYYCYLVQYLIHKLDLIKCDKSLKDSDNLFIPVEENMDIYQYLSSEYLDYLYIRNNVYIENMSKEEQTQLKKFILGSSDQMTKEIYDFIDATYTKVINENPNEEMNVMYGPNSTSFIVPANSVIIGLRVDDYKDKDNHNWVEMHGNRENELDFAISYFEASFKDKLKVPAKVIRYNDFSVKKKIAKL